MLNKDLAVECLRQLSNKEWQEFYWRGLGQNVICEPVELYESLINGSKLSHHIKSGKVAFNNSNIDSKILYVADRFFSLIEGSEYDVEIILSSEKMDEIRKDATEILNQI